MAERLAALVAAPRWRTWCLVVIAAGIAARVVLAVVVAGEPELFEFGVIGENLAGGRGYSFFAAFAGDESVRPASTGGEPLPSAFRGPAYAVVVAGSHEVADALGVGFARVLGAAHVVLAVATLAVVHRVAAALRPGPAALTATAAAAVYPPLVVLPSLGSSANVDQLALLLVVLAALRLVHGAGWRPTAWLSVAFAVLWLCRPEAPVFAVAVVAAAAFAARRWRPLAAGALAFAAAVVVVAAAWLVPRSAAMDRPLLTVTSSGGYNLWFGNAEGASGSQKRPPPFPPEFVAEIEALPPSADYELELDRRYRQRVVDDITDDPVRWAGLLAKKLALAVTFDPYDARGAAVGAGLLSVALTGAAAIVLWPMGGARRLGRPCAVPLAIAAAQVVLATAFFVLNRYKLTVDVQLLVVAVPALLAAIEHPTRIGGS